MKLALNSLTRGLGNIGGLSRQGVIATSRWVRTHPLPSGSQRALWLIPASVMIGAGVASLAAAGLGVAPFDVALSAIARRTPLSFGQAAWALSGTLFLVAAIFGVRPTGRSLGFMLLNGLTIDIALQVIVAPENLLSRIALSFIGTVVLAIGVATVVHQSAAGGAFESIMTVAEQRGRDPLIIRTLLEVTFLIAGALLGGAFGPMTVIIALSIGPAIRAGLQAYDDHHTGRDIRRSTATSNPSPQSPQGRLAHQA